MSTQERSCHYCQTSKDLRPYGPQGAMVCYDCAMATPEREAEAEAQFNKQMDAAYALSRVVIIGEETGPRPVVKPENIL